jgi:hypothetical protein
MSSCITINKMSNRKKKRVWLLSTCLDAVLNNSTLHSLNDDCLFVYSLCNRTSWVARGLLRKRGEADSKEDGKNIVSSWLRHGDVASGAA